MARVLQFNYIQRSLQQKCVSDKELEMAIEGLYNINEKIVAVVPLKYTADGELAKAVIVTEVETP